MSRFKVSAFVLAAVFCCFGASFASDFDALRVVVLDGSGNPDPSVNFSYTIVGGEEQKPIEYKAGTFLTTNLSQ